MNLILNRDFKMPEDGWYQFAPLGEFPHAAAGVVQVVDAEACLAMVARFKADAAIENFAGLLIDFDHFSMEKPANGHRRRAIIRVGFHSLRHSFVSLCAANRVPQVAIMELVGHGSPAMTALYSHAGDEQKAKAIATLPSFEFDRDGASMSKGHVAAPKQPPTDIQG